MDAAPPSGGFTSAGGYPVVVGKPSDAGCATYDVRVIEPGDAAFECQLCNPGGGGAFQAGCEIVTVAGQVFARCTPNCIGGRRPAGLEASVPSGGGAVRAYFEEMSRLEAASVPVFRVLARELHVHGAPCALRRAARRAATDEIRHARMGTVLAERFGGTYQRPRIVPRPLRSVEDVALDNATEGCVRETFGALVATWQARAANDPVVRRVMRGVAIDETRHAALALRVAEWADRRLGAAARRRVQDARRGAAEVVLRELECEPPESLVAVAGVPRRAQAQGLARALQERLWA